MYHSFLADAYFKDVGRGGRASNDDIVCIDDTFGTIPIAANDLSIDHRATHAATINQDQFVILLLDQEMFAGEVMDL